MSWVNPATTRSPSPVSSLAASLRRFLEEYFYPHRKPSRHTQTATCCPNQPHSPTPMMACLHRYFRKRFDCYRTKDERCSKNAQERILQQSVRYDRSFDAPISGCSRRSSNPLRCLHCHCRLSFYQTWPTAGARQQNSPKPDRSSLPLKTPAEMSKDVRVGSHSLIWHQPWTDVVPPVDQPRLVTHPTHPCHRRAVPALAGGRGRVQSLQRIVTGGIAIL